MIYNFQDNLFQKRSNSLIVFKEFLNCFIRKKFDIFLLSLFFIGVYCFMSFYCVILSFFGWKICFFVSVRKLTYC